MKKLAIIMMFGFVSTASFSQKVKASEVPESVKAAFTAKYANAEEVSWEKEDGNYEVGFEIGEVDHSALFSNDGKFIEDETEISILDLPQAAREYMTKNYASQKIKEAAKIVDASGKVSFEAEIKGKDVMFDAEGHFIKVVTE